MIIDENILDSLIAKAKHSPRLRKNLNLHDSLADPVQRMFNAIEPSSNIPIARHRDTDETIIIIKGKLRVITYNDVKDIIEDVILDARNGEYACHIPKGMWHKAQSLESGTIIFEVKQGPYQPLESIDIFELKDGKS
jgi:cupin fold WbuC family metalloprotein